MNSSTFDWEALLQAQLDRLPERIKQSKRLFATDLDGTLWRDILVELLTAFGTVDPQTGQQRFRAIAHAYAVAGTMTNGQHLIAEYKDLFSEHTLAELIDHAIANCPLTPGAPELVRFLDSMEIGLIAITNGARQIAEAKLAYHALDFPLIANWFDGTDLKFVHDEHVGIDKGLIVEKLVEWGWQVVAFGGDAKGDIAGAQAAYKHGALVLASGNGGLTAWCDRNLPLNAWVRYDDFRQAMPALQARLGGN